jgi:hypothetical protein
MFCTALHSDPQDFSVCKRGNKETLFNTSGVKVSDFAYHVDKSKKLYSFLHSKPQSPSKARSEDSEKRRVTEEK